MTGLCNADGRSAWRRSDPLVQTVRTVEQCSESSSRFRATYAVRLLVARLALWV